MAISEQVHKGTFGLPEDRADGFDERALENAIRENRRREFAALAQLDA